MSNNVIMTQEQLAIEDVKRLANIVLSLRDEVFKKGLDYGVIPGTGDKDTLLLPGMEKLMRALHLRPEYVEKSRIEDFDNARIYYRYECRLVDTETGICVSTAIGSANSYESKWRWRDQSRKCPNCGKESIIKGKAEYGGGWLCFAKKGGCGAKFAETDSAITGQSIGRIENPDIFDQMNTIDKIAQKRALGSAIKGAANVSEFFTVDLEDFQQFETRRDPSIIEGTFTDIEEPAVSPARASASVSGAGIQRPPNTPTEPVHLPEISTDDAPPNEYACDALIVGKNGTANTYALRIQKSGLAIPLHGYSGLADLTFGGAAVAGLARGSYPLSPVWRVEADKTPEGGWDVLQILTEGEPA